MRDYTITGLIGPISAHPAFQRLLSEVEDQAPGQVMGPLGLPDSARAAVIAALAESIRAPILWITAQADEARGLTEILAASLRQPERVHLLSAPDALPFERIPWDPNTREQRMAALTALHRWTAQADPGGPPVVVAPVRGLMVCLLPPEAFARHTTLVRTGDRRNLTELLRHLVACGYEVISTVAEPGQVAHRGGILDVFPPSDPLPTRIEWFGDDIESMRRFNPTSQRSMGPQDEVLIVPASEAMPTNGPAVARTVAGMALERLHPLAQSEMLRHVAHLARGERFAGMEAYAPLLHPERATALSYLAADALVVVDDPERVRATSIGVAEQAGTLRSELIQGGELPAEWPAEAYLSPEALDARLTAYRAVHLGAFRSPDPSAAELSDAFGQPPRLVGPIEDATVEIAQMLDRGDAVVVVSRQAPRIAELLTDIGLSLAVATSLDRPPGPGGLALVHGALDGGWILQAAAGRVVVVTDAELFGWRMPHRRRQARRNEASRKVDFFSELTPGDHIVHIEHGIGVFRGLVRMTTGSAEREYLQVEYAQGDTLYVPTHQADRVARYVGTGDVAPAVSRLGTTDWDRAKRRARRAVEDIARELLVFYARREMARRTPFAADTPWQAEMEAAFPFLETDDQLRAIEEVKRDMEGDRPMDRLVVGDVGFGKTEVALRAAFKAVMAGRQVAVLTPTTVLAQQHFDTFRQRLGAFPVRIEMLSRYRTRAEQAEIIDRLATREVDIVIGTHRLLSADIHFHDLGLLIVDEEHRFGVKHKERLRQLRESVDTLTLTATPIPRTMHMALSGLRDLTTIDTPPEERLPVATHIGPYDDNLVRQAIRRELTRRGQVFYVHNRVRGIEMIAQRITRLVPEARIGIAHGQMSEDHLARGMLEFVSGATDLLVCTSIIESGLDIQNANTLIVERADRFGLAQLHQLRGRVGRGAQRAYAYLLYPSGSDLAPDARQRLAALAEAQALGSGFQLAVRDLEIRGAGEILGARQHGQVTAIGLDLYTRLLAEAIKKLQVDQPDAADRIGREISEIDPGGLPTVDLPIDAHLPDDYVAETSERTRIYRRMAVVDSLAGTEEVGRELRDRFGLPPPPVANLLALLRLRVLAHLAGARSVGLAGHAVVVHWRDQHELDRVALRALTPPETRIGRHQLSLPVSGSPASWLGRIRQLLEVAVTIEGPRVGTGVTPPRPSP